MLTRHYLLCLYISKTNQSHHYMYYFVRQDVPGDHGYWAVDPFPSLQTARVWAQNRVQWGPQDNNVDIVTFEDDSLTVIETL